MRLRRMTRRGAGEGIVRRHVLGMCMLISLAILPGCTGSGPGAQRPHPVPPISASPAASEPCTSRGQHAVDVYSAMLAVEAHGQPTSDTAYVLDSVFVGPPDASRPGPKFTADVAQCIARGLGKFQHVVIVPSADDPRIPRQKSGGPIPFVKSGFIVTFGSVPDHDGRTQATVNTGGGFGFQGGEFYVNQRPGRHVAVVACGSSFIS